MLTGQAKKEYQRKYMLDYMRRRRSNKGVTITPKGVTVIPDPVKTSLRPTVKTQVEPVKPIDVLSELRAKTQAIIDQPADEEVVVEIPVYNRNIHKPGDMVLLRGKAVTVENLDADRNVIPEF